jgi:hypothetical protein
MVMLDDLRIHGLETRYADSGVMVSYVYPGAIEIRLGVGMTMPAADHGKEQWIDLGLCVADPDEQDPRDDRFWRWESTTKPATRIWAQHVMAVDARVENPKRRTNGGPTSLTYAHDGEVVLLWGFVPARADELALLAAGFRPSLATWRAPATADSRDVAARMARVAPVIDRITRAEPDDPPRPPSPRCSRTNMANGFNMHGCAGRRSWARAASRSARTASSSCARRRPTEPPWCCVTGKEKTTFALPWMSRDTP